MTVPYYPDANSTISVGDLENQNIDRSTNPIVMTRGTAIKKDGSWEYWDGIVKPYGVGISEGDIAGHSYWHKTGYNSDLGTTWETLWGAGGLYQFPAAETQLIIASTNANDSHAISGSGVRSVYVSYLDDTFTEKIESVYLTGTTGVSTVATDIYRINNFRVSTCGASGAAVGNISIRTSATTYSYIPATFTRARNMTYTVPTGKTLYIYAVAFGAGAAVAGRAVRFTLRASYDDKLLVAKDFFMPYMDGLIQDGAIYYQLELPKKFPTGVDIKVDAISPDGATYGNVEVFGWLEI